MQLVFQILIRVAEIMTIVAGVAGVTVSLLLLFSPEVVRKVSRTLNKAMLPENRLAALNASLRSELFVLEHHVICGSVLVAASIFILLFLFIGARVPVGFGMFTDMAMAFAILLGKTAGIVGFVAGALLFFSPGVFRALGKRSISGSTRRRFLISSTPCPLMWIRYLSGIRTSAAWWGWWCQSRLLSFRQ